MENPEAVKGMARYGINPENNLGVSVGDITKLSKEIGKDHKVAQELWKTKIRDARLLAALIEDPKQVTEKQLEAWVSDFNSWDICDHCCMHLLDKTPSAYDKVQEWVTREPEYVKRAGFALLASLTLHDKKRNDEDFLKYFPLIKNGAIDERNYVKKAVNWSLRTIGKRSLFLNQKAIEVAKEIQKLDSKVAKWIANDAIRELTSDKVLARLKKRENKIKKKK
jgi:3-methyladenine DNA glycosylase AlkD